MMKSKSFKVWQGYEMVCGLANAKFTPGDSGLERPSGVGDTKTLVIQWSSISAFFRSLPRPLSLALAFLAFLYVFHFLLLGFLVGPYDYNHLSAYYELAYRFWHESPGVPHYNPFFCGGRTLGADPQIPLFHPLALAAILILGPAWAVKSELFFQLALGLWGLNAWMKRWALPCTQRAWGIFLFAAGGFTVARFMVGHVTLGFYFLFPVYFLLSYQGACPRNRSRALSVFLLSVLCLYCGLYKPNFLIYAVPTLLVEALLRSAFSKSARPLAIFSIAVGVGALGSAVSLLAASDYFGHFPRLFDAGIKYTPPYALLASLLLPLKSIPEAWYGSFFMQRHEYSVFLGPVALAFAWKALSKTASFEAERRALVGFGLACAFLGMGATEGLSLYPYSWFVDWWPGFSSIRVPVRFWFGTYLTLILFSAAGFTWPEGLKKRFAIVLLGVLPLTLHSAVNLSKASWFSTQNAFTSPRQFPEEWKQVQVSADTPFQTIREGNGVIECVDNIEALRSSAIAPGPVFPALGKSQSLRWRNWNRLSIESAASDQATRITLGINHHPYWKSNNERASIVSIPYSPLTLEIAPGESTAVELEFKQPYAAAGIGLSLSIWISLLSVGAWFLFRKRKPLRIGLTGGIGCGKSTVARILEASGCVVVDLDREVRKLTETDPVIQQILRSLFPEVFQGTQLDRTALRQRVFSNPSDRTKLESVLHPAALNAFERRYQEAVRSRSLVPVVCEAPLLLETGLDKKFDLVLGVFAPVSVRKARVMARNGWSESEWEAVMRVQVSEEKLKAASSYLIDNSGTVESLEGKVKAFLATL
jgi:dephospho-CoA kinase